MSALTSTIYRPKLNSSVQTNGCNKNQQRIRLSSQPLQPELQSQVSETKTILAYHTLTSLSFTHIQFSPSKRFSKFFAFISLSPWGILCGNLAIILAMRDLVPLIVFLGQVLNESVNRFLKKIKQGRPTEYLGAGYGMPSSHAQFMGYFASSITILMYQRGTAPDAIFPHITAGFIIIWALLVIYSRAHLYYHTWQQVVVGAICGIIFALMYFSFINNVLRPCGFFDWIVDHPWSQQLYIRDTDAISDRALSDWETWRQLRMHKHR
ncbi:hypothetical protein BX616_003969 [Lobosporangium transversale]|uniref:Dolichyldiphosphatase n=1 Tax=Lobosporangium transversale TaxID=64571 RepID=A0A1Y2H4L0_9FUNG|nr:hypothetical protein BCR41DRAFT_418045 [Lobosporangium transversale]KAF9898475.1 hypothetical protein BX616_003969 [Lobosporangium transversale]ORZ28954.1 hypothetical protein BCR41DRAFT_418045 [Lobosporangium transversale]|eukprot:XP_021886627.1 hypothetical protein BCR41DRAFT_418045 [Lobosporangium transversale]